MGDVFRLPRPSLSDGLSNLLARHFLGDQVRAPYALGCEAAAARFSHLWA